MKRLIQTCVLGAKFLVTGAAIAAIAFSFGVFDPSGEVTESDADILALNFSPASNHEKMSDALERLGHPDPWPLNINGNVVYFSTKSHRDEPTRVMDDYLRKFYEVGVNRVDYSSAGEEAIVASQPLDALGGGAVPLVVEENHVVLGGVQTAVEANTEDELVATFETHDRKRWFDMFKGFRHVEMNRTGPETQVTSVWSDDDFDYEKMEIGGQGNDVNTSTELPSCPGCIRLNAFESLDSSRAYESAAFIGANRSSQEIRDFYSRAMVARGWEPTEANEMMSKVLQHVDFDGKNQAEMLQFARDGRFMTVVVHERGNQFVANLSISD